AADASATLWSLGRLIDTEKDKTTALLDLVAAWEAETGMKPAVFTRNSALQSILTAESEMTILPRSDELDETHQRGRDDLLLAFAALDHHPFDRPHVDLTLAIMCCMLLRIWARWLPRFSSSSVPYLANNFVRRPGRLHADDQGLLVELKPGPLDVVLEMAGYLSDLDYVSWIPGGRVRFRLLGE